MHGVFPLFLVAHVVGTHWLSSSAEVVVVAAGWSTVVGAVVVVVVVVEVVAWLPLSSLRDNMHDFAK